VRDVDYLRVREHPLRERDLRERADRRHDADRIGDELFVPNLEVAPRADAPSERTRVLDPLPPETRELRSRGGVRPRPGERPFRHLEEGERGVAPVPDEMD